MSHLRLAIACAAFVSLIGCSYASAAEPGRSAAAAAPSIESQFLSNTRQVTSGFLKAGEGYFSPDGKQIVYQAVSKDYPFYQIYTQSLQAAGDPFPMPKLISTGRGRTTCAYFSPDGKKILFASSHLEIGYLKDWFHSVKLSRLKSLTILKDVLGSYFFLQR